MTLKPSRRLHVVKRLVIDGNDPGVGVFVARGFIARLLGWHALRVSGAGAALWLPRCSVVHGLWLRAPLDLSFVDERGQVLARRLLRPGQLAAGPRGTVAVLESTPGLPAFKRLRPGSRLELGAAAVEFMLAVVLLLAPLAVASFELLQLAVSRQLLQAAAFDAVRATATANGDLGLLRRVLARGLVPLHGAPSGDADAGSIAVAYARALAEVQRPDLTEIAVLAPTRAVFDAHGVAVGDDQRIANFGRERVAANLLDIEITYCRALVIPGADLLFRAALAPTSLRAARCLPAGRMPITVRATTIMQSDASAQALGMARQ